MASRRRIRAISPGSCVIEQFLEAEDPDRSLVSDVMKECCHQYRYQFSQFKTVYTLVKAGRSLSDEESPNPCPAVGVQYKDMAAYSKAFQDRIDGEVAIG